MKGGFALPGSRLGSVETPLVVPRNARAESEEHGKNESEFCGALVAQFQEPIKQAASPVPFTSVRSAYFAKWRSAWSRSIRPQGR